MRPLFLFFTFCLIILSQLTPSSINAQASWGDYTLYSGLNSSKAYLLDMNGTTYHQWTFASNKKTGYSSYLLPGGTLVRTVSNQGNSLNGGGMTGAVQKVDWNGNVLWNFVHSSSTYCLHHDICPLPNGNVLMISYEVKSAAEATQAGSSSNITIWSEKIIEVQPTGASTGNIVWEWHAWDHLSQNVNSAKDNYVASISDHPERFNINYKTTKDWLHMNGLDYNAALDQIVFSCHNMNEVYVIDHSTTTAEAAGHSGGNSGKGGDFLYRWGNPLAYGASGTANFNVVHDAHFVPANCPNAGYIVAFNNKGGSGSKSCIDFINPPYDGYNYLYTPGTAYAPSSYEWRHTYTGMASQNLGNSQQLPNGNMLICIATSGYLYEIDSNQNVVWSKAIGGTIAQAFRYTSCYVSGTANTPTITLIGDTLMSSPAASYQWYVDNTLINGATSQSFIPTQSGSYQVQITDTSGCVSGFSATFPMIGAGLTNMKETQNITITPNPSNGMLSVNGIGTVGEALTVMVFDTYGRLILEKENDGRIDLSAFTNGIYLVSLKHANQKLITKRIVLIK